ncbi:MAG: hypothetical protein A2504_12805 [Bdellovibrionales bacterium RIFOXYD12_FULL_39_22]|nr:MAG: hypothetical protein A2385_03890 [Bdellovibrionales bacterium RIFOXYB1_FULL_39_21]OFZ40494.1 MAG: hypothetical protein A2485_02755 [Bdellovibrionales bacterium RIFOXYC12_FULL_39_17]OFZ49977.1 MAG: hypothetical protein A2404_02090 [Bdellovibrionales bacterium RIFOXYC1_FULL_39_130]OFZ77619.1 MAG: hypothetical protein A2560_04650 [Bdellovibrionales bacterium RIFOXYD1_FULL_39_84]OFZ96073.1 MAG: hypothetical protein A2504_12805 [Bdellovibrionales bacterium RIFOXYD12_FULL_39_22]HLE10638.1 Ch
MLKIFLALFLSSLLTFSALGDNLLFDTKTKMFTDYPTTLANLPSQMHLVLGEYHYSDVIQKAQAEVIATVVAQRNAVGNFTVGWEFLDYTNQNIIQNAFSQYKNNELDDNAFLKIIFPDSKPEDNASYLRIMQETKKQDGDFIGLNLPRALKKIVTTSGIEALDPQYIPANFELGGENYYTRFADTMRGHVTEEQLKRYYDAQCLTDSVMAEQIVATTNFDLNFTVVGAFHTDYNDGYVTQLRRLSSLPIVTIKFVDSAELTAEDIEYFKSDDPQYGPVADYVFFLNLVQQ